MANCNQRFNRSCGGYARKPTEKPSRLPVSSVQSTIKWEQCYSKEGTDREHRATLEDINEAHEQAHEEGFSSRREHRAYHRALRNSHDKFHEDQPNTRHDHYRSYQPYRWWRFGY